MKEKSWVCTLLTQLCLCIAAYVALNIGQPQNITPGETSNNGRPIDLYFLSVAGGVRSLQEQTLLLQQMAKVAKMYKARFVVDITELGESDALLQNAMKFPNLRNVPWYTSGALGQQRVTYFSKKIKILYGQQTLDIVALDTMLFQDTSRGHDQIQWLTRTLNESTSNWKIVVGFHQLISCHYNNTWKMKEEIPFEPLHNLLLHYSADAYISTKTCPGGSTDHKGPYLTAIHQNSVSTEGTFNEFLLHRVSSLEMATFVVKSSGEVDDKVSFQQRGRAVM